MKRQKIILCIAIIAVVSAVVFHFLIAPIAGQNYALSKEIKEAQAKLNRYQRLLSQKEYLQSRYRQFNPTENFLGSGKDALVAAFQELENLAQKAGVRIMDIRPANPGESDAYKEIVVSLKTEGDIESYFRFMYDIERSLSLLKIKGLQLNVKTGNGFLDGDFLVSQISVPD